MSLQYSIPDGTDPIYHGSDSAYEALMRSVMAVKNGTKKCACGKDVRLVYRADGKITRVHDKCRRGCPGQSTSKTCACGKPVFLEIQENGRVRVHDKCLRSCPGVVAQGMCALCLNKPVWPGHAFCGRTCGQKAKQLGMC